MDDLISRQAAIDALGEKPLAWTESEYELGLQNQWRYDVDAIKALPPVTPQPKTGHWIEYTRVLIPEPINKWEQAWYCSECGYGNQESDESAWLEWNFCPNCGRRMVEPQESEG